MGRADTCMHVQITTVCIGAQLQIIVAVGQATALKHLKALFAVVLKALSAVLDLAEHQRVTAHRCWIVPKLA